MKNTNPKNSNVEVKWLVRMAISLCKPGAYIFRLKDITAFKNMCLNHQESLEELK